AGGAGTQAAAAPPVPPPPAPIVTPEVEPPPTTTASTVVALSEPDQPTRTTVRPPEPTPNPPLRSPDRPDPPPPPPPSTPDLAVVVLEDDQVVVDVPSAGDASVATNPAHGSVSASGDGRWTYRPDPDYNGADRMVYERCGTGGCSEGTVSIEVQPVNDPPEAVDDQAIVLEDSAPFELAVLGNDHDKDGDTLSIAVVSGVSKGTATVLAGGRVRFDPAPDATGLGGFTYRIADGNGSTSTARVTIGLTPVNDAPEFVAGADPVVDEDSGVEILNDWATGIAAGPPDESTQVLTFDVDVDQPGLFDEQPSLSSDGNLRFSPADDANG
ncbi:MAG: Ig-like domain-containing protein, partial [Actinomycetota bacterium]